ncbi:MAG: penicillin-binding protein 2 [Parcubacteria group bacterium]
MIERRLRFFSICILLVGAVLIGRLYMVQIVHGETYKEKAERQYVVGANFFDRGSIFFTAKDGSLVPGATIKTGFTLAINPQVLSENSDIENVFQRLSEITEIDKETFFIKAGKTSDPYEEVVKRLPLDTANKIRDLKIPGVSVYSEKWRIYPGEEMAAHTIGFVGYKGDEFAGRYGLERMYEPVLVRSRDGAFVNFFAEVFSNIEKSIEGESLEGDIVTTIEPTVEAALEGELKKVTEKYGSEFSGGIIMDPKTGEIYAMALYPSFDPNTPQKAKDSSVFRNKLVEDRYEMGSIIKPLTLAAGIDAGKITARTTYNDPGCETLNKKTFCNYDKKSHGRAVSMQVALNKSLNTGMSFAVRQMGNTTFADYMFKFGVATTTGIDIPNEGSSLVSNLSSTRDLEHAQASFGQGMAITPIQAVRALSVLANGGTLVTPHLVKEIRHNIGTKKKTEIQKSDQVISPETSEEISRMLTAVVDYSLKDGKVRLENYSLAAKTGTAQIAKAGGYEEDQFLHSFFGYFPSYDAKFIIFLYTYNPKGVQYASETLTDSFIGLSKFMINYYDIPPDREAPPPSTVQ